MSAQISPQLEQRDILFQEAKGVSCNCNGCCKVDKKALCSQVRCKVSHPSKGLTLVKTYSKVTGRFLKLKICKCKKRCRC